MENNKKKLFNQIVDSAGNVSYTYTAHWIIVNRLKTRYNSIKVAQIVLTAISTGGFLASLIAGISWLSWIGGLTSAISLAINLYSLNFNLPADIKAHTDAANDLWDVKEAYRSLIVDIEDFTIEEIRKKRDIITKSVSKVNKAYPGTDNKSFTEAQKKIQNYMFEDGESAKLLHINENEDSNEM